MAGVEPPDNLRQDALLVLYAMCLVHDQVGPLIPTDTWTQGRRRQRGRRRKKGRRHSDTRSSRNTMDVGKTTASKKRRRGGRKFLVDRSVLTSALFLLLSRPFSSSFSFSLLQLHGKEDAAQSFNAEFLMDVRRRVSCPRPEWTQERGHENPRTPPSLLGSGVSALACNRYTQTEREKNLLRSQEDIEKGSETRTTYRPLGAYTRGEREREREMLGGVWRKSSCSYREERRL